MPLLFAFDMDDVLVDYDWRARMAELERLTGHDLAELRRRWWNAEGERAAETGAWADGDDYLAAVNAALGTRLTIDEFVAVRRAAMTPRPEVLAAVARAAELGRVTVLTNNGSLLGDRIDLLVPELVELFGREHLRASAHYGARKPDPAVYRALLAAYDAEPADTFFADDLPVNVEAAAALGITAHLYTDPASLLTAIEAFAAERAG